MIRRAPILLLALAACGDAARVRPGEQVLAEHPRIESREMGGRVDGDFVHPAFPPDGRLLAWSEVVVDSVTESTRLGVTEIETGRRRELVDPARTLDWGVYASFASRMEWRGSDTLVAELSDGDVGSSTVRMDVAAGRVIDETYDPGGEELDIPARYVPARDRIHAAFPTRPRDRVGAAANAGRLVDGGDRVVLQHAHAAENADILLLDLARRERSVLIRLADEPAGSWTLAGGTRVGDALVFLVRHDTAAFLLEHTPRGGLRRLGRLPVDAPAWLEPVHAGADGALLHLHVGPVRELRDSPLLEYRAGRLSRASDFDTLSDVAVDPAGRRIAFVHVRDGSRAITVKERD